MAIEVHLEPFLFPNFIRVTEWKEHMYPVGMLSDEQAEAYWDELRLLWLAHVKSKRKHTVEQLQALRPSAEGAS